VTQNVALFDGAFKHLFERVAYFLVSVGAMMYNFVQTFDRTPVRPDSPSPEVAMSPQSALAELLAAEHTATGSTAPGTSVAAAGERTQAARIVFDRLPIQPAPVFPASPLRPLRLVPTPRFPADELAVAGLPIEVAAPAHPLRLTRRGRLALVVLVAMLLGGLVALARSSASTASGPAPTSGTRPSLVVQPGDTLWSIATKLAPNADPRETVQRIVDLNGMAGTAVYAGEQLRLPS
jgi:hypothetical protein